jgi:hypothetical protein
VLELFVEAVIACEYEYVISRASREHSWSLGGITVRFCWMRYNPKYDIVMRGDG